MIDGVWTRRSRRPRRAGDPEPAVRLRQVHRCRVPPRVGCAVHRRCDVERRRADFGSATGPDGIAALVTAHHDPAEPMMHLPGPAALTVLDAARCTPSCGAWRRAGSTGCRCRTSTSSTPTSCAAPAIAGSSPHGPCTASPLSRPVATQSTSNRRRSSVRVRVVHPGRTGEIGRDVAVRVVEVIQHGVDHPGRRRGAPAAASGGTPAACRRARVASTSSTRRNRSVSA